MAEEIRVSVIVPVYNGEETLDACLVSLLDQTYPQEHYEILVIDNNSTDKTPLIIKKYSVKRLSERQIQSSYAARNCGIRNAKGKILAFIDADCVASRQWIAQGISLFTNDKIGAIAGEIQSFPPQTIVQEYLMWCKMLSQEITMCHPFLPYPQTANAFFRREVVEKIGFFETWLSGGDADFAWRMQLQTSYQVAFARDAIVQHQHRKNAIELFFLFKKYGAGTRLLERKYRHHIPKAKLYYQLQELWYLCRRLLPQAIISYIAWWKDKNSCYKARYDLIAFLGRKIGMWIGT